MKIPGARIGQDLWLVNAQRVVLTRERLREALAGRGHVFDNAAAYRHGIDERLFHLGQRRYDALMDTLIQLRQPQLSRRPDEGSLSNALTEALAPLPQELLGDVAEAMNQLEEDRHQLDEFQQLQSAVVQFDARYRLYAGVLSRRQARELRQTQTEFDNASRERNDASSELASAVAAENNAVENHAVAEIGLQGDRMRLDTLLADPAMQAANRLDQAERDLQARQRDFENAEEELRDAGNQLQRETALLRDREQRADQSGKGLAAQRGDAEFLARQTGLETEYASESLASARPDDLAELPELQIAESARRLHESVGRRRKDLALIRQRVRERSESRQRCEERLAALQVKQDEAEEAAARRADADSTVESEAQRLLDAWSAHLAQLGQLRVEVEPVMAALSEWVLRPDAAHPGREPARTAWDWCASSTWTS